MFGRKKDEPKRNGLPELPAGYFWRVGPKEGRSGDEHGTWDGYGIALYCLGDKKPIRRSPDISPGVDLEQSLKMYAGWIKKAWENQLQRDYDNLRFSGDYPPKEFP